MISRVWLLSAWRWLAAAPGSTTLVGVERRPDDETVTWPNRPSWKVSLTVSLWVNLVSMPSWRSRSCGAGAGSSGNVTAVGATAPVPQATGVAVLDNWVWSWNSATVPVTRTRSPTATWSMPEPRKTNTASDVAALPSPVSSCR